MTPYIFGQKVAIDVAAIKQPMEKAVSSVAKSVPNMLNMTRASGVNPLKIVNQIEHNIKVRTGDFPSNWETVQTLMDGLPHPYPPR